MAKPFDATTKHLLEAHPSDWLAYVGLPLAEVVSIESNLSTVTAEADKVFLVKAENPWLVHLEIQSSYDGDLGGRTLRYNVLLEERERLPVQSIIVLLRADADGKHMTGRVQRQLPDGQRYLDFQYNVIRAWEKSADSVLEGGLGTLPLAPLSNVAPALLPGVISEMRRRIDAEATTADAAMLWTATYVLMGLRYTREMVTQLLQGVRAMRESVTYQAILEEGMKMGEYAFRLQEARALLFRLGEKRFGPPDSAIRQAVESIDSLVQMEHLNERILDVESWLELIG